MIKDFNINDFDVFISYSSSDINIAKAIHSIFEEKEIRCWMDKIDIPLGEEWDDYIAKALEKAKIMVLVYSSNSMESKNVKDELNVALKNDIPVFALRIEDIEPKGAFLLRLDRKHWLDALSKPCKQHIENLAVKVKIKLKEIDSGNDNSPTISTILPEPKTKRDYSKIKSKTILLPLLVILLAIGIAAGYMVFQNSNISSSVSGSQISINEPINGQKVPMSTIVKGTSKILSNQNIYLLIQPQSLNNDGPYDWWVYEANMNSDGSWESNVQIGLNNDTSRKFRICAIITEEKLEIGDYGPNLPNYKEKSEISVERE